MTPSVHSTSPPRVVLVVSAAGLVLLALRISPSGAAIGFLPFLVAGPALAWTDLSQHLLPRRLSHVAAASGFVSLSLVALVIGDERRITSMIAGGLVAWILIGMLYIVGRALAAGGALGRGDLHLAPLLGVHLGWFGSRTVFGGLVLGWILIGVAAALLLARRRVTRSTDVPLGPSLLLGAYLAMLIAG